MAVEIGDRLMPEKQAFVSLPGTTRENYFLYGLRYKITVRTSTDVSAVYLYSSATPEGTDNKFTFTNQGSGVFTYEGTAGSGATALSIVGGSANFADGVKFYFRLEIVGVSESVFIDRIFWVRDPVDILLFTAARVPYKSPFAVLIGSSTVIAAIAPNASNESGVNLRGGIVTVEVFKTPTAPSTGNHVTTIAETAVANITSIELPSRDNAGSIPNFIPPPGAPDASRYYHYVTFRLRAKQASAYYRDIDVLFFASASCAIESGEDYGWDSDGSTTVGPPEEPPSLILIPPTEEFPPVTTCSSYTLITTSTALNQYSHLTEVVVYDAATGGNEIARGAATVEGETTLKITRTALGGDLTKPIQGYFEIIEYGPDRTSTNRLETYILECATPLEQEIEITTITCDDPTGEAEITTSGDELDDETEYTVIVYDDEFGGTIQDTFSATVVDGNTLTFILSGDTEGYFVIVADGSEITAPRHYATLVIPEADTNFWRWDIAGETWEMITSTTPPDSRYHHSMFTIGSKLYIRGGRDADSDAELGDVWEYNPATNAWTQLPTPVITHPTRYWHLEEEKDGGGTSVFIGGYSGGIRRGTFYEFTPPNTYVAMADEPTGIFGGPGFHLNAAGPGVICYHCDSIPNFYLYDYISSLWGNFPCGGATPNDVTAQAFANGASCNKSWVFGGDDAGSATNQVFYYDLYAGPNIVLGTNAPASNKDWAAAFISGTGKFLLFGGEIAGSKTDRTWLMTEATQAWVEKSPATKPPARTGHRMRALGGYVYLFGGKK